MMQACNEKDPTKSPYEDVLQSLIEEGAPGTTLVGIPLEEAGPERMARKASPLPQPEVRQKIYNDIKHALREEGLAKEGQRERAKEVLFPKQLLSRIGFAFLFVGVVVGVIAVIMQSFQIFLGAGLLILVGGVFLIITPT